MLKVNIIQLGMVIVFLTSMLFIVFSTPEQDLETLLKELRCVTCPNQNIADSQAAIATAMREEIISRYQKGESTVMIRQSMLSSYGDYLSYRPIVKLKTYFLWFTPIVMLMIGLMIWFSFLNKGKVYS